MGTPARRTLYPAIKPYRSGWLRVSSEHEIYWEECGNPQGKPAVFVHGGPGAGAGETSRRFFDPRKYRIVLFDQRGCGRSKPHASLVDNTTQHLVADMEALRKHLAIERWLVFGGSWGSTLSLAYAQAHPKRVTELVLRGIFMLRDWEIHWFYQHGASAIFPDHWANYVAAIPPAERGDLVGAFYKRLTSRSRAVQLKAAKAWAEWEAATSYLLVNEQNIAAWNSDDFAIAVARIECHYFVNQGFFERRKPVAAGRAQDPQHPGRDRAGPLRRRVPDAQRVGPAQGMAGSRLPSGCRRGTFGAGGRQHARARVGDRSVRAVTACRNRCEAVRATRAGASPARRDRVPSPRG